MQDVCLDINAFYVLRFIHKTRILGGESAFARYRAEIKSLQFFAEMTLKINTKNRKNVHPPGEAE